MSTVNVESRVIKAPQDKVWSSLSNQDFAFWSLVQSSKQDSKPTEVGGCRSIHFKDGTIQKYRLLEFSEIKHTFTYEMIESEPAVPFLSVQHTLTVRPVTADDTSFVEWTSNFSSDGSPDAVADAKYKKQDALADLAKVIEK